MFVRLAAETVDAAKVAEIAVSIWQGVGAVLSPIIGQPGVAALFKRSIYLARTAHPFLAPTLAGAPQPGELAALQAALALQCHADAVAANAALLQTFNDLLIALIGKSLTERLLRPVWDHPSSDAAVQDTTS